MRLKYIIENKRLTEAGKLVRLRNMKNVFTHHSSSSSHRTGFAMKSGDVFGVMT